jgi:adenine-specific DNA-methyltransferase
MHFSNGGVVWPRIGRKPNWISRSSVAGGLLVQGGFYVLVKRFTSKEERRRLVAAVFDPAEVPTDLVGFENHLNYFHASGAPMKHDLARGLAAFLNSGAVDTYVRQFNGHTQINATDLRSLRYPSLNFLVALGGHVASSKFSQERLDALIDEALSVAA